MTLPFASADGYEKFECLAMRLIGPVFEPEKGGGFIFVDVDLPEKYKDFAVARGWNADGTYRVEATVRENRRSLSAFIASGDLERDVSPSRMRRA
ncbi:hypothetical protein [Burkholderia lata]|uniref:Uncharacterized protein n=1 Tax=Burkholderia lata (strain ATCC 17760 / DSM 23089 / LMG 22485 / NCIMB 9086 / R18194 / 383) TaxID=482957 RepID=A0A6P2LLN9_BURL3|nr:hypothetical protein [Burkholderia lata]VWB70243.1 hypothetical protein BLA6863_03293 [Burkholderia lata]